MGSDGKFTDGLTLGYVTFKADSKDDVARMLGATLIGHNLVIDVEGWLAALVRRLRRQHLKPTGSRLIVGRLYNASGGQLELELDIRYRKQVTRAERLYGKLAWRQM